VTCSHSGGTKEVIEANRLAKERGAYVITMTNNAGSAVDNGECPCWVYEWEDDTPQAARPAGFSLMLVGEIMAARDGWGSLEALEAGIKQLDGIIAAAMPRVEGELGPRFVDLCKQHDFFYILGSGPTFCQTYGFAICSLMEMQWQNCSYINSAEYFHGPFECTEPGVFYFLQKSSGKSRPIDERAERFLQSHTDTLMVLDSAEYGMGEVDAAVRDYLDPIFFYFMNVALRGVRGAAFDHDPDMRRYMGVVEY
jgi:fructoselysine-6-P-deglycase FrlB-like protein